MWYVTSQKNGASALGLQRVLGLGGYLTAWTCLHKLRRAMVRPGRDRLGGNVEVDETLLGGVAEGPRGRGRRTAVPSSSDTTSSFQSVVGLCCGNIAPETLRKPVPL